MSSVYPEEIEKFVSASLWDYLKTEVGSEFSIFFPGGEPNVDTLEVWAQAHLTSFDPTPTRANADFARVLLDVLVFQKRKTSMAATRSRYGGLDAYATLRGLTHRKQVSILTYANKAGDAVTTIGVVKFAEVKSTLYTDPSDKQLEVISLSVWGIVSLF